MFLSSRIAFIILTFFLSQLFFLQFPLSFYLSASLLSSLVLHLWQKEGLLLLLLLLRLRRLLIRFSLLGHQTIFFLTQLGAC